MKISAKKFKKKRKSTRINKISAGMGMEFSQKKYSHYIVERICI